MDSKIEVICDWQISPYCKVKYLIGQKKEKCNRKNNNGKYRCKYCAIEETHYGEKSHFYKYTINHNFFNTIDCELKAYMLGVIAGDGSITDKSLIIVSNEKDVSTLALFQKYLCPEIIIRQQGKSNCKRIQFTSRSLSQDLCRWLKIKPGKKSNIISLPDIDSTLMPSFIRGLMDTDGNITNPLTCKTVSPRCFYSSTSKVIIEQIKHFLLKQKILSWITYSKDSNPVLKLNFTGHNALNFMHLIYDKASFFLPRKKEFYDIWKTWVPYDGISIRPSKRKLKRMNNGN
jgi:LAGLIDADG-like domain